MLATDEVAEYLRSAASTAENTGQDVEARLAKTRPIFAAMDKLWKSKKGNKSENIQL